MTTEKPDQVTLDNMAVLQDDQKLATKEKQALLEAEKHIATAEKIHAERLEKLRETPLTDHVTVAMTSTTMKSTTDMPNGETLTTRIPAQIVTTTTVHTEAAIGQSLAEARAAVHDAAAKTHEVERVVTHKSATQPVA